MDMTTPKSGLALNGISNYGKPRTARNGGKLVVKCTVVFPTVSQTTEIDEMSESTDAPAHFGKTKGSGSCFRHFVYYSK